MPNYSINSLSVTGDSKDLRRFRKNVSSEENDLSLEQVVPDAGGIEGYSGA